MYDFTMLLMIYMKDLSWNKISNFVRPSVRSEFDAYARNREYEDVSNPDSKDGPLSYKDSLTPNN